MLPHHFIAHHWRTVLAVVAVGVLVWFCLPAPVRSKLSAGWKKLGHALGNVNARILLTALYAILILPFGLAVRLFSDSLHTKKRPETWFDHPPIPNTLEEARRQG
jgi:Saxitoxin biosynthesis operon protein SxtJ